MSKKRSLARRFLLSVTTLTLLASAFAQAPMGADLIAGSFGVLDTTQQVNCSNAASSSNANRVQCFVSSLSFERLKAIILSDIEQTQGWGVASTSGFRTPNDGLNGIVFENLDGSSGEIYLYPQGGEVYIETYSYY